MIQRENSGDGGKYAGGRRRRQLIKCNEYGQNGKEGISYRVEKQFECHLGEGQSERKQVSKTSATISRKGDSP